jgi:hypothetical protein
MTFYPRRFASIKASEGAQRLAMASSEIGLGGRLIARARSGLYTAAALFVVTGKECRARTKGTVNNSVFPRGVECDGQSAERR